MDNKFPLCKKNLLNDRIVIIYLFILVKNYNYGSFVTCLLLLFFSFFGLKAVPFFLPKMGLYLHNPSKGSEESNLHSLNTASHQDSLSHTECFYNLASTIQKGQNIIKAGKKSVRSVLRFNSSSSPISSWPKVVASIRLSNTQILISIELNSHKFLFDFKVRVSSLILGIRVFRQINIILSSYPIHIRIKLLNF